MPILSLIILLPLVGATILLLVPSQRQNVVRVVAAVAAGVSFALSLYVFLAYDYQAGGHQFVERYRWLDQMGISVHLGVDGMSVPLVLLTGIVIFTGVFVSWKIADKNKDFFILLLTLVSGVFGVFESLDAFFFFFFYELAVLPMYLLIGVWGSSSVFPTFRRPKEYGAMKLVIYLVAGSILVWIGIIALFVASPVPTLDIPRLQQVAFSQDFQTIFFPFFMVGFGVLAGLWPFHTWSPDGHVAAPTAVSMLHAGVLMKLGAFGIVRLGMTLLPQGASTWMPLLIVLGTTNVIYGAVSAMGQKDLKYVIGYSSVSHMGLVLMGLATLSVIGVNGAVLQMFSHGIMTALFFALVGTIYDQAHTREIAIFGGLATRMKLVAAFFVIAGLTSLGLPGLSGFVAEFLIFVGAFQTYPVFAIIGIIAAAVTAVYILRLLATVFFGPLNPRWEHLNGFNRSEAFATTILVLTLIIVGVYPAPFINRIAASVAPLLLTIPGTS